MERLHRWLESHITLHTHDSPREERLNSLTHGAGALLSLAGLILLLRKVSPSGDVRWILAAVVYGTAMILTYGSSSLYHLLPVSPAKRILRILDHVNIYILIAATYTPMCLSMNSRSGGILLGMVWGIAALGTVFKLVFWGRVKPLHTVIYLLMGWLIVFFFRDLKQSIPPEILPWILGGGVSYTVGTLFYALKKIPYYHAIWHSFVLLGSACFYLGFYKYIF